MHGNHNRTDFGFFYLFLNRIFQVFQLVQFFDCGEFIAFNLRTLLSIQIIMNLFQTQEILKDWTFDFGKFYCLHFFRTQPVFLVIFLDPFFSLLLRRVISRVYNTIILPHNILFFYYWEEIISLNCTVFSCCRRKPSPNQRSIP